MEEYYVNNFEGNNRGGLTFTASPATASVPTGEHRVKASNDQFTVPNGITVVMVSSAITSNAKRYIGVTPGKTYKLTVTVKPPNAPPVPGILLIRLAHDNTVWYHASEDSTIIISWSPEINKQTPTMTDY